MLTQHKTLSTFLVLLFIFAVSQLLALFTLLNKPVRRLLPENNLALEPYSSIIEPTPDLELARLMAENQTPISSDAPEAVATIPIPTATLSHREDKKEGTTLSEPLTGKKTTAPYSNKPDHLVFYAEASSATDHSISKASQGCAKILEQAEDNRLNQPLCIELYRDDGDRVADSISDALISFSLSSNNSQDESPVYEFTNLSAGHYFAIFYQFNQLTWQTAVVEATPMEIGYMVRFWQAKKKPQAPQESTDSEARREETKPEADAEANGTDSMTNQEREETNEGASEANNYPEVNRADSTISQEANQSTTEGNSYSEVYRDDGTSSQRTNQATTQSNSYPESSDAETITVTIEEANEWSSEVEGSGYPAPRTSDDISQEGTTEWYYESYSDSDSYQWSWWEEESEN